MENNNKILIMNIDEAFSKRYNKLDDNLVLYKNNNFINDILLESKTTNIKVEDIIYKNSLDVTQDNKKLGIFKCHK